MRARVLRIAVLGLGLGAAVFSAAAGASAVVVGRFSSGDLAGWEERHFEGATEYRIAETDGERYVAAKSMSSSSGLYRTVAVDLTETPCMTWRWRVDTPMLGLNERVRAGDDHAARVYAIDEGFLAFWRTRAVGYVWSGSETVGAAWRNPYTENAQMVAVRGPDAEIGTWYEERRNVVADFEAAFGETVERIEAVAIVTDSDDSMQTARAAYGDIAFTDGC